MAYDTSIPAGGHGNFKTPNLAHEGEGVRVDFLTVDYIWTRYKTKVLTFLVWVH